MNQPDRYEKFVLLPDQKKVTVQPDTRIKNATTFVIEKEDHTIGNMVRYQLFRDKNVTFSGYRCAELLAGAAAVLRAVACRRNSRVCQQWPAGHASQDSCLTAGRVLPAGCRTHWSSAWWSAAKPMAWSPQRMRLTSRLRTSTVSSHSYKELSKERLKR
jgi:hypothetical protein